MASPATAHQWLFHPWQWWMRRYRDGWAGDPKAAREAHQAALRSVAALGAIQERSRAVADVSEQLRAARLRNGFADSLIQAMTPELKKRKRFHG